MQTNYMNTYTQVFFVFIYMQLPLTSACGTARAFKASRYAQSVMGTECSNNHKGSELCSGVASPSNSQKDYPCEKLKSGQKWGGGGGGTIISISSVDQIKVVPGKESLQETPCFAVFTRSPRGQKI